MPTYNQAQYLGQALDSLLAQTVSDWEAVVVDDGSIDGTPEVLRAYRERDTRIRAFRQDNGGVASALNRALGEARGRWICWLSSDDLFVPTKLEVHGDWIRRHPGTRFFFSLFRDLDDTTGRIVDPPLWRALPETAAQVVEMMRGPLVHGNSVCVDAEAFRAVGPFDEELRYGQDADMWLRLAARCPAVFVPERTCVTRHHSAQMTHTFSAACTFDHAKAAIRLLNDNAFPALFPALDLASPADAARAVDAALTVLVDRGGSLYALGAHPALALRILEWVSSLPKREGSRARRRVEVAARRAAWRHQASAFGTLMSLVAAASRRMTGRIEYRPVDARAVAETECLRSAAEGDPHAEELKRYLERFGGWKPAPEPWDRAPRRRSPDAVVVVVLAGTASSPAVSAAWQTAERLRRCGAAPVVLEIGRSGLEVRAGLLVLGVARRDLERVIREIGAVEVLLLTIEDRVRVRGPGLVISLRSDRVSGGAAGIRAGAKDAVRVVVGSEGLGDPKLGEMVRDVLAAAPPARWSVRSDVDNLIRKGRALGWLPVLGSALRLLASPAMLRRRVSGGS